ncbi:MAG: TIGR03792 family protein [Clostridia bacterium]
MKLKKFKQPLVVEELVIQVRPDLLERWFELDHQLWTLNLAKCAGFAGKEIWVSKEVPGEVTAIIYWNSLEEWKSIDEKWLIAIDQGIFAELGKENVRLVREIHHENQKYKVSEYR